MSTKNNTEAAKILIAEICNKYSEGSFIFRGTTRIFSGKPDGVSSSLYRWAKKKKAITKRHKPPKIEKEIVDKAKRLFPDQASNIEILTDMRHYGGKVNLIDFTRSLYAALFFACNGDVDEDGEIIVVDTEQLSLIKDIEYNNLKDEGMIEPAKTQASQLRVVAQDSIFVYYVEGYIEKPNFKSEKIPKELKKDILDFVRIFSNIDQNTVYNDLIGFIDNEENYDTAGIRFHQGNAKSSLGDDEGAIQDYNQAIELNPQLAEAYYNRGLAKSRLGQNEEAIKDYDKAIELNPQLAEAYCNRGVAKNRLREYEEAIKDFNQAIELNPQDAKAYYNRGLSKYYLEEYEEAIRDYDQAIKLNPQLAEAYNNRGVSKSSLGKHREAIKDFNKAIELNPQSAEAYNNRGYEKYSLGKNEEAIEDFNQAIEIDSKYANAYNNRGNAKGKLGDTAGAEADLAKAKELKEQQKKK